jgi:tRNA modification GTPase
VSNGWLDTIVAPATPVGRSALAIVRIDGPRSSEILLRMTGAGMPDVRMATLTQLKDIDECIAIRYAAPHSFTGNDLVELTLHGNPLLVRRVVETAVSFGARIAEPGEFTERAVLNGKLDLIQAESIANLINARTPLQARLSLENLEGSLSRTAAALRDALLFVISRLEAGLDFSEEGYEFITREDVRSHIEIARGQARSLGETFRRGRASTAGLSLVILGLPNAGKSTLLNRLVGSDRAIVTPIPGTTRDIVSETIEMGGLPVTILDTAGLRTSSDEVETIGIDRARAAGQSADIVLYLIDATVGLTDQDRDELAALGEKDVLIVHTKIDLAGAPADGLGISVTAERGIDVLLARLDDLVKDRFAAPEGSAVIVNERQRGAVAECEDALAAALESIDAGMEEQIMLVDLYRASTSLGLLIGAITRDDVFAEIFSKFCIGK